MRFFFIGAIAAFLLAAPAVQGQATAECSLGVTVFIGYGIEQSPNAPYHATVKTTFEQKLADGNSIQGFVRLQQARDSMGRTRGEMAQGCERGEDGQLHARLNVTLTDPVAKTNSSWLVDENTSKIVHVFHQDEPPPPHKPSDPSELAKQRRLRQLRHPSDNESRTEDLGEATIAGIAAHGSRTVRTIPAGQEGNALPLVVLHEQWHSNDHKILLKMINDDPRRGRTTVEVEDLVLSEPDASLFTVPAGYKIEDVHPTPPAQDTP